MKSAGLRSITSLDPSFSLLFVIPLFRHGPHVAGFYAFLSALCANSMHYFSIMESLIEAGHAPSNEERERREKAAD